MPQSLGHIILHLVFSTKDRTRFIDNDVAGSLHAYLATVCRDQGCHAYRVGGTADHVHMVTTLSRTETVSKLMENVKKYSSAWMKRQGERKYGAFFWQRGYGAFSVSPSHLDAVIRYVSEQEEHHRKLSFQEEYRHFLEKYGIQYDERYVWD